MNDLPENRKKAAMRKQTIERVPFTNTLVVQLSQRRKLIEV